MVEQDYTVKCFGTEVGRICHNIEVTGHPPMLHTSLDNKQTKPPETDWRKCEIMQQTDLIIFHQAFMTWGVFILGDTAAGLSLASFLFQNESFLI